MLQILQDIPLDQSKNIVFAKPRVGLSYSFFLCFYVVKFCIYLVIQDANQLGLIEWFLVKLNQISLCLA
jgi:hypothetical protein